MKLLFLLFALALCCDPPVLHISVDGIVDWNRNTTAETIHLKFYNSRHDLYHRIVNASYILGRNDMLIHNPIHYFIHYKGCINKCCSRRGLYRVKREPTDWYDRHGIST